MTKQKCKRAAGCMCYVCHEWGWSPPCYEPDESPQLWICPDASKCRLCVSTSNSGHAEPHAKNRGCGDWGGDCPACIPCDPPAADAPTPLDLDAIRHSVDKGQMGAVASLVVAGLCDALEQSRKDTKYWRAGTRHWRMCYDATCQQRDDARSECVAAASAHEDTMEMLRLIRLAYAEELIEADALKRERSDLRERLALAEQMHCAGDDDPDAEDLIPMYKCNAADSRPVFCADMDCPLHGPHGAGEHPGCRGGSWWCPSVEGMVECEVVE